MIFDRKNPSVFNPKTYTANPNEEILFNLESDNLDINDIYATSNPNSDNTSLKSLKQVKFGNDIKNGSLTDEPYYTTSTLPDIFNNGQINANVKKLDAYNLNDFGSYEYVIRSKANDGDLISEDEYEETEKKPNKPTRLQILANLNSNQNKPLALLANRNNYRRKLNFENVPNNSNYFDNQLTQKEMNRINMNNRNNKKYISNSYNIFDYGYSKSSKYNDGSKNSKDFSFPVINTNSNHNHNQPAPSDYHPAKLQLGDFNSNNSKSIYFNPRK